MGKELKELENFEVVVIICDNNNYVEMVNNKDNRVETALYCIDVKFKIFNAFLDSKVAVIKCYGIKQATLRAKLEKILTYI